MKPKKQILLAVVGIIMTSAAFAQQPAAQQTQCPDENLIIGTGTPSGTYAPVFASLAAKCSMVCENRNTQGGYDNITNIMNKKFDGGIVQIDTLDFLNRMNPNIKQNVRSIISLHSSSMHIFTLRDGVKVTKETAGRFFGTNRTEETIPVKNVNDLKGMKVAAWSSAVTTATIMDERLRLSLDIIEVKTRADGLKMLKNGEVAAFMGMGGVPLDWVEGVNGSKAEVTPDLAMVNVSSDDLSRMGSPYYGVKVMYRNINALGVNLVTVRNEVVVWNIQKGPRANAISEFQACFKANLEDIQNARGSHAAWADVVIEAPLGWEPYRGSASAPTPAARNQVPQSRGR